MVTFSHSGKIGDILYSLHYVYESTVRARKNCNFNINTGIPTASFSADSHDYRPMLTMKDALFIKPLLKTLPFINDVTIDDDPVDALQLDDFRRMIALNQSGGDIRDWYYQLDDEYLPRAFWQPIVHVTTAKDEFFAYRDSILVSLTDRYRNPFVNFSVLRKYFDNVSFLGTQSEFDRFDKECFHVDGIIPEEDWSLLDIAKLMSRVKGFIGNQSGLFALAEMMKIPRILVPADWVFEDENPPDGKFRVEYGGKTTLPIGGWCCTASTTERLEAMTKEMLMLR